MTICLFYLKNVNTLVYLLSYFVASLNELSFLMFRVSIKESSVAKLGSVCRRVYRIFSHAFFHHRSIYDEFEVSDLYKIEMKFSLVQI